MIRRANIFFVGLLNFFLRFLVGGVLLLGAKLNPTSLLFGFLLTLTALVVAVLLLRFVVKPTSLREALAVSVVWVGIALLLDVVTAEPIVKVSVPYLFSEPQTWTRLAAIVVAAPLAVRKQ